MNLNDLSFEEVKTLANSVEGFKFHHMTGEVKLKEDLAAYLEANPDKIPGSGDIPENNTPPEPPVPPVPPVPPENNETKTDLVKIKSKYRGEIMSSFGMMDFGIDGIAEVSVEAAEFLCGLEEKGYEKC